MAAIAVVGAIPPLAALLRDGCPSGKASAVSALAHLAAHSPEPAAAIATAGAMPAIARQGGAKANVAGQETSTQEKRKVSKFGKFGTLTGQEEDVEAPARRKSALRRGSNTPKKPQGDGLEFITEGVSFDSPERSKTKKKSVDKNNTNNDTKSIIIVVSRTRTRFPTRLPRRTRTFWAATASGKSASISTRCANHNPLISCSPRPHQSRTNPRAAMTRPKMRRTVTKRTPVFLNPVGRIFSK